MESLGLSAIAATASAIAAFASLYVSVRLAELTSRALQIHIEPSISIEFDHDVGSERNRTAIVQNQSACDLYDLIVRVSNVSAFEEVEQGIRPTVLKSVGVHDLQRWFIPKIWRRRFGFGSEAEVDSDSWFIHAREVLSLPTLSPTEKIARGLVILDVSCRRAADQRRFSFEYVYSVQKSKGQLFALPQRGSNPADADKKIIVRPIAD